VQLMNAVLPVIAICVSVAIALLNHRDRIERRHGELSKLRSDCLQRLSVMAHRMQSIRVHLELARLEVRNLPNSDFKYEQIERMPPTIGDAKNVVSSISELKEKVQGVNTIKENRSDLLMFFQSAEGELRIVDDKMGTLEKRVLDQLTALRALQEAQEAVEANKLEITRLESQRKALTSPDATVG
jgi:hypothetical protein